MSVYIESSAVAAWLLNEDRRDEVVRAIATTEKILTSALTELEFSRSVTRARISGRISAIEAETVLREFEAECETWEVMDITDSVMALAREEFPFEPVRALDAIHLASAQLFHADLKDVSMLSFDTRIRANAPALGLALIP